jgi:hypothetical protein
MGLPPGSVLPRDADSLILQRMGRPNVYGSRLYRRTIFWRNIERCSSVRSVHFGFEKRAVRRLR